MTCQTVAEYLCAASDFALFMAISFHTHMLYGNSYSYLEDMHGVDRVKV